VALRTLEEEARADQRRLDDAAVVRHAAAAGGPLRTRGPG